MADVRKDAQEITRSGITPVDNAATLVDTFLTANDGRVFYQFKNTGAGASVVTIATPGSVDGLAIADRTITIPATTGNIVAGPWSPTDYGTDLRITFSVATGVTFAAFRLPS